MIPSVLRPQVGDQSRLEVDGTSVGEVLNTIAAQYPEFGKRLFADATKLNRYINVFVNEEDIRFLQQLETPVGAKDEVTLIPSIAGG
jgi:molybdopterin converting factor small subunit